MSLPCSSTTTTTEYTTNSTHLESLNTEDEDNVVWIPYLGLVFFFFCAILLSVSFFGHWRRAKQRLQVQMDYLDRDIDLKRKRLHSIMRMPAKLSAEDYLDMTRSSNVEVEDPRKYTQSRPTSMCQCVTESYQYHNRGIHRSMCVLDGCNSGETNTDINSTNNDVAKCKGTCVKESTHHTRVPLTCCQCHHCCCCPHINRFPEPMENTKDTKVHIDCSAPCSPRNTNDFVMFKETFPPKPHKQRASSFRSGMSSERSQQARYNYLSSSKTTNSFSSAFPQFTMTPDRKTRSMSEDHQLTVASVHKSSVGFDNQAFEMEDLDERNGTLLEIPGHGDNFPTPTPDYKETSPLRQGLSRGFQLPALNIVSVDERGDKTLVDSRPEDISNQTTSGYSSADYGSTHMTLSTEDIELEEVW